MNMRAFDFRDEIGYMAGDMAGSFVNLYIEGYFLTFCTYVLGIEPQWMAGLFLIARLLDACLGPIIGSVPDRRHFRNSQNKFLPWIKLFSVPLSVSGVLCFLAVPFQGNLLHLWAAGCYMLYSICYSGASIPYGAMANVVTSDPGERGKLSRARSIGGTVVAFGALSLIPAFCFDSDSNLLPGRFTLMAVVFGIFCFAGYRLLGCLTKERIQEQYQQKESYSFGRVLQAAIRNRPLIGIMTATIGCMMALASNQLSSYIYKEYYRNTFAMTIGSLANLPVLLICFPLVPRFSARLGKRRLVSIAIIFSLTVNLYKLAVPISNVWVYTLLFCLANAGQTVFNMLIWAMVADCLDYSEWKLHFRSDGSMYGLYTFSRKLGSTAASAGAAAALSAVGYVSGNNIVQSIETVGKIYYLVNGIAVLVCIIELIGLTGIYNLNQKTCDLMYKELAKRHNEPKTL